MVKSYFPVTSQAAIDELRTIEKIKMLVKDEIIVLRDAKVVEDLVRQVLTSAGASGGEDAANPPA